MIKLLTYLRLERYIFKNLANVHDLTENKLTFEKKKFMFCLTIKIIKDIRYDSF